VNALRLRNFGPLRAVVHVEIDGRPVTSGGLVLNPFGFTDLERPMDEGIDGRFTVAAEGNEAPFGADGGRDNNDLGLIDARFRRELPAASHPRDRLGDDYHIRPLAYPDVLYSAPDTESGFDDSELSEGPNSIEAFHLPQAPAFTPEIERAAGTGLTGHSDQTFVPVSLGALEPEETVIQLRLVIGSEAAIANQPAVHQERPTPSRPAARP
jgi:hypothetical protein